MKSPIFIIFISVGLYVAPSTGQPPAAPIPTPAQPSLLQPTPNPVPPPALPNAQPTPNPLAQSPLPNAQSTQNPLAPSPQQAAQPIPNLLGQAPAVAPVTATGLGSLTLDELNMYQYLTEKINQGSGLGNNLMASPTSFLRNTRSLLTGGIGDFMANYDYPISRGFTNGIGLIEKQLGANVGFLGAHAQNLGNTVSRFNKQVQHGLESLPLGVGMLPAQAIATARQLQIPKRMGRLVGGITGSFGQALDDIGTNMIDQTELSHAQASLQRNARKVEQIQAAMDSRAQARARLF